MSQQLINRSPDLTKLLEDGYEIEIRASHLIIHGVPYVNRKCEIRYGILVSKLSLAGDKTVEPATHVAMFSGETPCDEKGIALSKIINSSISQDLGEGIVVNHTFSSKPKTGHYADYYEQITTYVAILSSRAEVIDPNVTARTFRVIESINPDSPFQYLDTASSRAGINKLTSKLELEEVCIVGLGGTGSYILDFIAKAPVKCIRLFDNDTFLQHNAFRSPGAPSVAKLMQLPLKVDYWKEVYSRMHQGVEANSFRINKETVECLCKADFVFLCMDGGIDKKHIIEKLEEFEIPFIDVGMGLQLVDDSLVGLLRVTTSTPEKRDHVHALQRVSFLDPGNNDLYSQNIQVAELNALNAILAVLKWKKIFGFYKDLENEHFCIYEIDGNHILNEDRL